MRELSQNELIILRGTLCTKRLYKGMKHIPHGAVVWEDWMEDTLTWVNQEIEEKYPDTPKWGWKTN